MSLSMVTSEEIRRHPVNTSPSKITNQFSKTARFISPNPECPHAFYTYDSQLSNRKASIGYGKKSDFTKDQTVSPPASKYLIKSFVEESRARSHCFGQSRDKLPDNSYLIPQLHKMPGPGAYENQKAKQSNIKYTVRPKPLDFIEQKLSYKKAPGPGAYEETTLDSKKGRFYISKFSDTRFSTINPKTARFSAIKESPGPSLYKEGDSLSKEGKYLLSHRKSDGNRLFSKTSRPNGFWSDLKNPGPGQYSEFSDFGKYGDAKYYQTLQSK